MIALSVMVALGLLAVSFGLMLGVVTVGLCRAADIEDELQLYDP